MASAYLIQPSRSLREACEGRFVARRRPCRNCPLAIVCLRQQIKDSGAIPYMPEMQGRHEICA